MLVVYLEKISYNAVTSVFCTSELGFGPQIKVFNPQPTS